MSFFDFLEFNKEQELQKCTNCDGTGTIMPSHKEVKKRIHPLVILIIILIGIFLINSYFNNSLSKTIVIKDNNFKPDSISIKRNSVINIFNDDKINHSFKFGNSTIMIASGETIPLPFNSAGAYIIILGEKSSAKLEIQVKNTIFD